MWAITLAANRFARPRKYVHRQQRAKQRGDKALGYCQGSTALSRPYRTKEIENTEIQQISGGLSTCGGRR